ncbi:hypothetical protein J6590_095967 [Homalodisca vitripennis]|nr:hypothetical protein J6590_095967 [Homalodisca vitripennis]
MLENDHKTQATNHYRMRLNCDELMLKQPRKVKSVNWSKQTDPLPLAESSYSPRYSVGGREQWTNKFRKVCDKSGVKFVGNQSYGVDVFCLLIYQCRRRHRYDCAGSARGERS